MSQRELADACMFDVTTLSRTLDKMEKAGLVTRKVNPASRRAHLIALTPEERKKPGGYRNSLPGWTRSFGET